VAGSGSRSPEDGGDYAVHLEDLDVSDATFASPDLTKFCRLDDLGLVVTGQRIEPDGSVLACRVVDDDRWCRECGCEVVAGRDRGPAPAVAKVAEGLGVAWNTANDAVLAEGRRVLIDDEHHFDGVKVVGVDEHVWRHTRRGDKYVTVIIDLTGIRDGTGPARLLDMVEGRSKQAFKTWLAQRPQAWRDQIEVVAMDGFTGFKTATTEELPDAVAVMDPFHVVRLAGDALDKCRRRVQQALHGHRGRTGDPLYSARRMLHTGAALLTERRHQRLDALLADDDHVEVEVTWSIYQRMITAYREPDRTRGRELMGKLIASLSHGVPAALSEIITLGRTLNKRAADVLAYFDRPGTSNGPTEAINGRPEHLRGSALGFRNLTNYIARSLLETGGIRPQLHPRL
jgi:hypothetical protein